MGETGSDQALENTHVEEVDGRSQRPNSHGASGSQQETWKEMSLEPALATTHVDSVGWRSPHQNISGERWLRCWPDQG